MNLPSDPIVLTSLTGFEFATSGWTVALYSSVESFNTNSNSVNLNFTIGYNNQWFKALGFVIAFSKSYFNKRGIININYSPGYVNANSFVSYPIY